MGLGLGPRMPRAQAPAGALLLALALGLAAGLGAVLLDYGPGRDQGIYAVVAHTILDGGAPYLDAWDFKPPGIHLVFALARALFGDGDSAARWLELLGLASLGPAFWMLSKRAIGDGRAGLVALAVAALSYVPLGFWQTAQPEGFGGMLLVWALVCAFAAEASDSAGRSALPARLLAGALYSAAALMKPPLGGGLLVSLGFAAHARRGRGALGPALALGTGALLPLAATGAWLAFRGALGACLDALLRFAPHYTALSLAERSVGELFSGTALAFLEYGPYPVLGIAAFFALPPVAAGERRAAAHLLGVAGVTLLGVALQAKFFPYHYSAALLLLSLPAGWGLWKLWRRIADRPLGWLLFALLLAAAALPVLPAGRRLALFWNHTQLRYEARRLLPDERQLIRDRLHSLGGVDSVENRRAAAWLAQHTRPDDPIFVWGFEPILYEWSGRRPASRFIYNVPQRAAWSAAASRARLMQDLRETPPAAVVVVRRDKLPHVTGNPLDSGRALAGFPELFELFDRDYEPGIVIGDLEIRRRRGSPP